MVTSAMAWVRKANHSVPSRKIKTLIFSSGSPGFASSDLVSSPDPHHRPGQPPGPVRQVSFGGRAVEESLGSAAKTGQFRQ